MIFESLRYHCLQTVSSQCASIAFLFSLPRGGLRRLPSPYLSLPLDGSSHILNNQPNNHKLECMCVVLVVVGGRILSDRCQGWLGKGLFYLAIRVHHFSILSLMVGEKKKIMLHSKWTEMYMHC